MNTDPLISEFVIEIRRFDEVDHEIEQIPDSQIVGSLELDFSQSLLCLSTAFPFATNYFSGPGRAFGRFICSSVCEIWNIQPDVADPVRFRKLLKFHYFSVALNIY